MALEGSASIVMVTLLGEDIEASGSRGSRGRAWWASTKLAPRDDKSDWRGRLAQGTQAWTSVDNVVWVRVASGRLAGTVSGDRQAAKAGRLRGWPGTQGTQGEQLHKRKSELIELI